MLVERIHRPYSYLCAYYRFPKEVEVWTTDGELAEKLASLPLAEQVPIDGVPTGPRDTMWRPTEPATLVWAEALDGGNPKTKVPYRDRILLKPVGRQLPNSPRPSSGSITCNGSRREGWSLSPIMIPIAIGLALLSSMPMTLQNPPGCFGT